MVSPVPKLAPTHFLNVDIDVSSRSRLEPLVAALGSKILVHYVGPERGSFGAHFSLALSHGKDPDSIVRELATLISRLPAGARKVWNAARSRTFNVGVQSGIEPFCHEVGISEVAVTRAAQLQASIVLTTYGAQPRPIRGPGKRIPARGAA